MSRFYDSPIFSHILKKIRHTRCKTKKRRWVDLEKARKKIAACVITVLLAAIVAGLVYYTQQRQQAQEHNRGTLVIKEIEDDEHGIE